MIVNMNKLLVNGTTFEFKRPAPAARPRSGDNMSSPKQQIITTASGMVIRNY